MINMKGMWALVPFLTAVWSKGMCLMGKFNCIPNCSTAGS